MGGNVKYRSMQSIERHSRPRNGCLSLEVRYSSQIYVFFFLPRHSDTFPANLPFLSLPIDLFSRHAAQLSISWVYPAFSKLLQRRPIYPLYTAASIPENPLCFRNVSSALIETGNGKLNILTTSSTTVQLTPLEKSTAIIGCFTSRVWIKLLSHILSPHLFQNFKFRILRQITQSKY